MPVVVLVFVRLCLSSALRPCSRPRSSVAACRSCSITPSVPFVLLVSVRRCLSSALRPLFPSTLLCARLSFLLYHSVCTRGCPRLCLLVSFFRTPLTRPGSSVFPPVCCVLRRLANAEFPSILECVLCVYRLHRTIVARASLYAGRERGDPGHRGLPGSRGHGRRPALGPGSHKRGPCWRSSPPIGPAPGFRQQVGAVVRLVGQRSGKGAAGSRARDGESAPCSLPLPWAW